MIVLDLTYWNVRWRPWREWAHIKFLGRPASSIASVDALLENLPHNFVAARGERLD